MTELPMLLAAPADETASSARSSAEAQRFRVDGMDCASCARTVEKVVADLDGVRAASVSFGNATLLVDGDLPPDAVEAAVRRAGYRAELAGQRRRAPAAPFWRRDVRTVSTTASIVLLLAASLSDAPRVVAEPLYLLSMAVGGWPIGLAAAMALRRRALDMNVLMAMAALGAVAIGEYAEGAWVLVLFAVGTTLEGFALDRSRRSVELLMELAPDEAHVLVDGREQTVAVRAVAPGALLAVRPGERLPLDGVVVDGISSVDESALTGESVPVDKEPGSEVFAGTLNAFGALTIRATSGAGDSTLARVAHLVADAQGSRAPSERFVDRFARIYTPVVFAAALLVALIPIAVGGDAGTWVYRALALLIVACPCALVISVPVSVVSAIGGAARRGVLIKGGQALEDLGRIRVVALDKTGTLTEGRPQLASIAVLAGDCDDDAYLSLMAAIERGSEHPLGRARGGRSATRPRAGARGGLRGVPGPRCRSHCRRSPRVGGRSSPGRRPRSRSARRHARGRGARGDRGAAGEGDRVLAVFGLADQPRAEAAAAVAALRARGGADHVVMLTGDSERVARAIAARTGVREWRAGLLPEDKLAAVRELRGARGPVAMVGDGINDAPALAGSTVGVAMGLAGSDVALESADVTLMADDLERLPDALHDARRALRVMRQNVVISLATKAIFVVLAPLGYVTLVVAVAADMGISLLVTLNGLRLLGKANGGAGAAERDGAVPAPVAATCADACCTPRPSEEARLPA